MNTGEFAKFCGVEKRTLFHYDQIGLLKPVAVRENGYREYAPEQIYLMDMIKIFQSCGYTLSEIKDMVNSEPQEKMNCICNARERIDSQIQRLLQMRDYLQAKQDFWNELHNLPLGTHRIQNECMRYDVKPIDFENVHYFNFLNDGTYSSFIMHESGDIELCKLSESGKHFKEGHAISFFMKIRAFEPEIMRMIKNELTACDFQGEDHYYIENSPHFLLENPQSALVKVTVFENH